MKPDHKELKRYPEAVQCNNAIDQVNRALQNNQWAHAKDLLENAMKYADQSSHLLLLRSRCYYNLGEYYESIADTGQYILTMLWLWLFAANSTITYMSITIESNQALLPYNARCPRSITHVASVHISFYPMFTCCKSLNFSSLFALLLLLQLYHHF